MGWYVIWSCRAVFCASRVSVPTFRDAADREKIEERFCEVNKIIKIQQAPANHSTTALYSSLQPFRCSFVGSNMIV